MWGELAEEACVPCAAEEEEGGGPAGGGRGAFGAEDVGAEVGTGDGLVDITFGRVEECLVAVEDVGGAAREGSARREDQFVHERAAGGPRGVQGAQYGWCGVDATMDRSAEWVRGAGGILDKGWRCGNGWGCSLVSE